MGQRSRKPHRLHDHESVMPPESQLCHPENLGLLENLQVKFVNYTQAYLNPITPPTSMAPILHVPKATGTFHLHRSARLLPHPLPLLILPQGICTCHPCWRNIHGCPLETSLPLLYKGAFDDSSIHSYHVLLCHCLSLLEMILTISYPFVCCSHSNVSSKRAEACLSPLLLSPESSPEPASRQGIAKI